MPLIILLQCLNFASRPRLDDAASAMHMHAMNRNEKVSKIRTICVYCGSSPGTDPAFVEAARVFGTILANNGIRLVFGGGAVGIMGAIAKSVVDHGGKVTGIIPEFLVAREHAMRGADSLIITRDMHERKRKMFEMADGFVALPGGKWKAVTPDCDRAPDGAIAKKYGTDKCRFANRQQLLDALREYANSAGFEKELAGP